MNKGHNKLLICPLFIYGYQFQTTINPLPDALSVAGTGHRFLLR